MPYQLPPAGTSVNMRKMRRPDAWLRTYYRPYIPFFLGSGTQALAAALCVLSRLRPGKRKVLIPGYTCPSLVSAVRFAGCRAVPVDIEANEPRIAEESLKKTMDESTLAVIGVDLFGISERYELLARYAHEVGAYVIRDAAQRPMLPSYDDKVDMVVLSYGRGKPVSVLEGGALLICAPELVQPVSDLIARLGESGGGSAVRKSSKVLSYRLLRYPWLYWLPANLPFLGLGKTEYHPLASLAPMSRAALSWLPANLPPGGAKRPEPQKVFCEAVPRWAPFVRDVASSCSAREPLGRMPLLAASEGLKRRILKRLRPYGASPMYPAAITEIPGAFKDSKGRQSGGLPNAADFAARIFTLPLHEWMNGRVVAAIEEIMEREIELEPAEVTE